METDSEVGEGETEIKERGVGNEFWGEAWKEIYILRDTQQKRL